MITPLLAVAVRRLHDRNKSEWWLLIVHCYHWTFLHFVGADLPAKEEGNSYNCFKLLLKKPSRRNPSFWKVLYFHIYINSCRNLKKKKKIDYPYQLSNRLKDVYIWTMRYGGIVVVIQLPIKLHSLYISTI